jgi:hypothetical protein
MPALVASFQYLECKNHAESLITQNTLKFQPSILTGKERSGGFTICGTIIVTLWHTFSA